MEPNTFKLEPKVMHEFIILVFHSPLDLESAVVEHLNSGWHLMGNMHTVGYLEGVVEFMWAMKRETIQTEE